MLFILEKEWRENIKQGHQGIAKKEAVFFW